MNSTESSEAVIRNYPTTGQTSDRDALPMLFAKDATRTLIGDLPTSGAWHGHRAPADPELSVQPGAQPD